MRMSPMGRLLLDWTSHAIGGALNGKLPLGVVSGQAYIRPGADHRLGFLVRSLWMVPIEELHLRTRIVVLTAKLGGMYRQCNDLTLYAEC